MEKGKVLVRNTIAPTETKNQNKKPIHMKCEGNKVYIGQMPQLVVDIKTQENYIIYQGGKMPYYREISFSRDLLEGKKYSRLYIGF